MLIYVLAGAYIIGVLLSGGIFWEFELHQARPNIVFTVLAAALWPVMWALMLLFMAAASILLLGRRLGRKFR